MPKDLNSSAGGTGVVEGGNGAATAVEAGSGKIGEGALLVVGNGIAGRAERVAARRRSMMI